MHGFALDLHPEAPSRPSGARLRTDCAVEQTSRIDCGDPVESSAPR